MENQEPDDDRSQDDPHPEVGPSVYQSLVSIDSDPDEAPHRNFFRYLRQTAKSDREFLENRSFSNEATVLERAVVLSTAVATKNHSFIPDTAS